MPASSGKKKKENIPIMSMAGLIRYYEEEKGKIRVDPKVVLILSVALSVGVLVLTKLFPIV